jgi:putative mRNA 3-end processing factor
MRIRGIRKRRAVDRGLVLSARPDHPNLLATVRRLRPTFVLTYGGHAEAFARQLRERGQPSGVVGEAP